MSCACFRSDTPGSLEEDLVGPEALDDRLAHPEGIDPAVDHLLRLGAEHIQRGRGRRGQLVGAELEHELGAALEIQAEVGLDLDERAAAEAHARAIEREGELMLRDIDEHRQDGDEPDDPRPDTIHLDE